VQVDHFTYGLITPTLSYALSFLGSLLGLVATVRARATNNKASRARWLLLAAWAIGGTGIWVMHFMAMLGFSVPGEAIRYDISLTFASWLTAIVVVGIGLFIVGFGRPSALKIIAAGVFTGVGVAAMHYTGMAAMKMPAHVTYDRTLVAASVGIAVVASTVALWFTVTLKRGVVLTIAALIMAIAVNGMHFTGMFAMRVSDGTEGVPNGMLPVYFLVPISVFVVAVAVVLLAALINRTGTDNNDGGGDPTVRIVAPQAPVPGQRRMPTTSFVPRRS